MTEMQAGLHVFKKTLYSFEIYKEQNKNVCHANEDPNFTICDDLIKSTICAIRTKEKEKQEKRDKQRILDMLKEQKDMLQEERKERRRMFDMLQKEKVERKRMFDMLQAITKKQLPVWQKY